MMRATTARPCRRLLGQRIAAYSTDALSNVIPKTGKAISRLGFGAYRVSPENASQLAALRLAVQRGVNVIDTSAHFGDGASERAIGTLFAEGTASRKDLYVITKAGFITPYIASLLARKGVSSGVISRIGASPVSHSIAPAALRVQLAQSLELMQTGYVDLFMINCPERLLASMSSAQLESALRRAIECVAGEIEAGRVRGFGITSTDAKWALPADLIASVLGSAQWHGWHGVQVPANLCETQFLEPQFLQRVKDLNLALFTHRLVTAISPRGVQRLSSTIAPTYTESTATSNAYPLLPDGDLDSQALLATLSTALERLSDLEETLADRVDDSGLANKFIWSGVLPDTLDKLLANEVGARFYFDSHVLPPVKEDAAELLAAAGDEAKEDVKAWIAEYTEVLESVALSTTALAHAAATMRHRETRDILALYAPHALPPQNDRSGVELPEMSFALVNAARSDVPGATLVGMRHPEYVDRMVSATTTWVSKVTPEIWAAVKDAGVLDHVAENGGSLGGQDE
ncbi:NADP-dependent oxidoreductase domain-containing protein [Blastocladiella britannica]|nr:NADP-dependent oxidoreductase domain-containing protein [Blastocladiella britannica]